MKSDGGSRDQGSATLAMKDPQEEHVFYTSFRIRETGKARPASTYALDRLA
jgi:hypothetical protein